MVLNTADQARRALCPFKRKIHCASIGQESAIHGRSAVFRRSRAHKELSLPPSRYLLYPALLYFAGISRQVSVAAGSFPLFR